MQVLQRQHQGVSQQGSYLRPQDASVSEIIQVVGTIKSLEGPTEVPTSLLAVFWGHPLLAPGGLSPVLVCGSHTSNLTKTQKFSLNFPSAPSPLCLPPPLLAGESSLP